MLFGRKQKTFDTWQILEMLEKLVSVHEYEQFEKSLQSEDDTSKHFRVASYIRAHEDPEVRKLAKFL